MTETEQVVRWLRDIESQHLVINPTMAMRNSDVIHAMRKCADIIEMGNHLPEKTKP